MTNVTVLGGQFGDEGKGRVVDWLCGEDKPDVVTRFSGGHQAAHHVIHADGTDHVFANFGSGTVRGVPTYWSKYCTVDPIGIINELTVLKEKNIHPLMFIDGKCPVTTPYEKYFNQSDAMNVYHGTCGCGVGATWQREEDNYSILAEDIFHPSVLKIKIKLMEDYYDFRMGIEDIQEFYDACYIIRENPGSLRLTYDLPKQFSDARVLFEGSQGLLLDQKYGFFPHVTRSNLDTKNIDNPGHLYLVTRAYQTRHGNGPMTNEKLPHNISDNPFEQNIKSEFQGGFRISTLDLDLLSYSLSKDPVIRRTLNKTLVITCLDLVEHNHSFTYKGKLQHCISEEQFIDDIKAILGFVNCLISKSSYGDLIATSSSQAVSY